MISEHYRICYLFTKIKSNKDYIFALGWAATKDQIKKENAVSYIYINDWNGDITKKVTFNRNVSNFCIDHDSIPYVIATGDDDELHVFECEIR